MSRKITDMSLRFIRGQNGLDNTYGRLGKLKVISLFSGIGCQERGLADAGYDVEVVATSEINCDSILAYAILHNGYAEKVQTFVDYPAESEMRTVLSNFGVIGYDWQAVDTETLKKYWYAIYLSHSLGSITQVEQLPYADLWTISSPCTDISVAGLHKGIEEGSETSSSLIWEALRLLKRSITLGEAPKVLLFENVSTLKSVYSNELYKLSDILSQFGYSCYYKLIDAVDCGVPQSRLRLFIVFVRTDVMQDSFEFPEVLHSDYVVADLMETERVAETYYLSEAQQKRFELTVPGYSKESVRKLMPEEAAVLMGFTVKDGENLKKYFRDSQIYMMMGNGIVTNCIAMIGEQLYRTLTCDLSFLTTGEQIVKSLFSNTKSSKSVGGIYSEEKGRYMQGYRCYGADGVSCTLTAQGGGIGGPTGLYALRNL